MKDILNRRAWVALAVAILLVVAGELILAWQYQRLETQRLPQIEEEVKRQDLELQERDAEDVLKTFLQARVDGDESRARIHLTEQSVIDLQQGGVELLGSYASFVIEETLVREEGRFRFQVGLLNTEGLVMQLELIEVREIAEKYFVHSIVIAG